MIETSKSGAEGRLRAAIEPFVDRHELAGAVMLAATPERILAHETVGWANVARREPMPPDALFWIASQTKPMTATCVMMMIDEGWVSLDDPLEKYLPELRGLRWVASQDEQQTVLRAPAAPPTIRQALAHTAGFRFSTPLEQPTLDRFALVDAVRGYGLVPLDYEPGSRYQYSNIGTNVVARIVEIVCGQPFEDYLQSRVLDPLGMSETTFWPTAAQIQRLPSVYGPNAAGDGLNEQRHTQLRYPLDDRRTRYALPAGGLFSTAHDCLAFLRLLVHGGVHEGRRLLSAEAVAHMTQRQTPPELDESYGLGLAVWPGGYGHGGAAGTHMSVHVEDDLLLVWLVQHGGFPGRGAEAQEAFVRAAKDLPR
ncbi:MAG TPA: serine hydrolase [Armatimonadetes bacterium]|nr:serine hydrolase [Armatimonadota bacterium]